jgi:hypothetical protein
MVEDALEVTEDMLHGHEMGLTKIMHVKVHLLGRVGDVNPSEGEVLESPGQAMVGSWAADNGAPCRRRHWPECQPAWSERGYQGHTWCRWGHRGHACARQQSSGDLQ